jgi:hypothetical protein
MKYNITAIHNEKYIFINIKELITVRHSEKVPQVFFNSLDNNTVARLAKTPSKLVDVILVQGY